MAKKQIFNRQEKLLLFSLAFVQFSHIVDFMILMPLGPQLMRTFNINPHEFGILVSAYTFAAGTTGLLSALFIDGFDRKKALLFFYVGFGLGTLACAAADGYHELLIARTLTGAFGGVLSSLTLAIVGDAIDSSRRGTAMGTVMASFSLASIFGVPFSLYLANHFDWHAPFVFLGATSLLLIGLITYAIPSMKTHLVEGKKDSPAQVIGNLLSNPNQIAALVFMMLLVFGQFSIIPFLSPSYVANAGMTEAQLPLVYLVGGGISIITSPLIGRWSDLSGKRKVFIIGALMSIVPIFAITNLSVTPLYILLPLTALFFVCMGGRMIPAMAMVTSTVTPRYRGSFMSITSSVQQFASALAAYVAGIMITKGADGRLANYDHVGYIAIVFSVLAVIAAMRIQSVDGKI